MTDGYRFAAELHRRIHLIASASDDAGDVGAAVDLEQPRIEDSLSLVHQDLGPDCQRCRLCEGRRNVVFGVGSAHARLLVVGEAPGEQEDTRGEPFVGQAGVMLDAMMTNVLKIKRSDAYITNVVKCRPPDNRDPQDDEIASCLPFLQRQVDVVKPAVILLLGSTATRAVFGEGVGRVRGTWRTWRGIRTIATFHPAYLLRKEREKGKAFEDLTMLARELDGQIER